MSGSSARAAIQPLSPPPTVHGAIQARIQNVDGLGIFGIGVDVRVVPGALAQIALVVGAVPRVAAVVRAEHAAGVGLDDRPHALVISGYCYAYFADDAFGQPFVTGYFFPRVAAVGGL